MDDGAIARTDFERLGESIFSERHLRVEHLDAKLALGWNRELNRHLEHVVWLAAGGPPFGELGHRRQPGVVAPRRARVPPPRGRPRLLPAATSVVPPLQH